MLGSELRRGQEKVGATDVQRTVDHPRSSDERELLRTRGGGQKPAPLGNSEPVGEWNCLIRVQP